MSHTKRFAMTCTVLLFAFTVAQAAKSDKPADLTEKKAITKAAISNTEIAKPSKQAETERLAPAVPSVPIIQPAQTELPLPDVQYDDNTAQPLTSDAAAAFEIPWQSINGGGGPSSSTNYSVNASVGQSTIGSATSTNYEVGIGYWYGVNALTGCSCPTHGDPASTGVIDVFDVLACVAVAFQNGPAFTDAGCPFSNTDVSPTGGCSGAVDVFDVLAFVNVAFQNGSPSQFCNPCL